MNAVSRLPGTSLHHQISTLIKDGIAIGRYRPGEQLPTEAQLGETHQVSRVTVRNALRSLEQQGLIERRAGSGTFVSQNASVARLATPIGDYFDQLAERRKAVHHRVIEWEDVAAPVGVGPHLGLDEGATVRRIVRLRSMGRLPIVHGTLFLPEDLAARFTRADFNRHVLSALLARQGRTYSRIDMVTRACLAEPHVARLLQVPIGSALVEVHRIGYDSHGAPMEFQLLRGPPDRFQTRVTISGDGE